MSPICFSFFIFLLVFIYRILFLFYCTDFNFYEETLLFFLIETSVHTEKV
ncbi:hypothetical protein Lalb_Chr20g0116921 [Lupinus albus]|uniref:Uncharacterized protein n=1 Tax=Lupinus albus TaxID=3870 RepID=A0A6A4NVC7_LUPAL|nr:hypothetical protein Lalb_Chr20g0116921 [Lupinus albus]